MDKELYCEDLGMNCEFMACGTTEEEVLRKAARHALIVHQMDGFSEGFEAKAREAIREGYCGYGEADEAVSEECAECYEACFGCADECCS